MQEALTIVIRSRCGVPPEPHKPACPIDQDFLTRPDQARGVGHVNDGGEPYLAGDDRAMAEHPALFQHKTAGDEEQRRPGWVCVRGYEDVSRLQIFRFVETGDNASRASGHAGGHDQPSKLVNRMIERWRSPDRLEVVRSHHMWHVDAAGDLQPPSSGSSALEQLVP